MTTQNGKKSIDDLIERLNKGIIYIDTHDMYAVNERETKLLIAEAAEALKLSEKRLAEKQAEIDELKKKREPLSDEFLLKQASKVFTSMFVDQVRWTEKHHNIGLSDE